MYKDSTKAKEAAQNMKTTVKDLKKLGIIDDIIKEDKDGAEKDFEGLTEELKKYILKNIKKLQKISPEELIEGRYEKFRNMNG